MKKKNSQSSKWFSNIDLNWDAVRSFISDVDVEDKIPKEKRNAVSTKKVKPVSTNKEKPKHIENSDSLKKVFVDRNKSVNTVVTPNDISKPDTPNQAKKKESLIDIVETLESCASARKGAGVYAIARVHCLYDNIANTFWFTNKLYAPRELSSLNKFGRFVPRYSDVAIRMQKNEMGSSFDYYGIENNCGHTFHVTLENRTDLQNQNIVIAGDNLTYQYRNIQEFLEALRQNMEDINDVLSRISELEGQRKDTNNPHQRGQITNSIKKLQTEYRILTQQQEDLKNITIYIRKQGEMRYSYYVDPIQTRIMAQNRFDGKTVVIKGGPGTGKTTTMIHRLSYLTDAFAIKEDEEKKLNNYKLNPLQRKQLLKAIADQRDWMFFSPSQMLKDYLSDAMKKEGLTNTSEKVWNWKDYCRTILQVNYHLLEMNGSKAPFKVCYISDTLFYQNADIINAFCKFFLDELREIKAQLPPINTEETGRKWISISQNIKKRFENSDNFDLAHFVSLFNSLESVYGNECKELLRDRNNELSVLANEICSLLDENKEKKLDLEDILELSSDEQENVSDEEYTNDDIEERSTRQNNKTKENRLSVFIQKWLKAFCYSKITKGKELTEEQKIIAEVLLPLIDSKFDDNIQKIGELMVFEQFAQYTRGLRSIMLNGLPTRYKRFRAYLIKTKFEGCNLKLLRDIMQRKQGKELHHQEQSLLLGFINTLVKLIKASNSNISHEYIEAYDYVSRPIIGIDEVTDFSICDIYAMQSLLNRDFYSLTVCGDVMQRMTSYGIKSWKELDGVIPDPYPIELKTSYRQSKKLLEVAKQLYSDVNKETPNYRANMKFNKVPAPLVFCKLSINRGIYPLSVTKIAIEGSSSP